MAEALAPACVANGGAEDLAGNSPPAAVGSGADDPAAAKGERVGVVEDGEIVAGPEEEDEDEFPVKGADRGGPDARRLVVDNGGEAGRRLSSSSSAARSADGTSGVAAGGRLRPGSQSRSRSRESKRRRHRHDSSVGSSHNHQSRDYHHRYSHSHGHGGDGSHGRSRAARSPSPRRKAHDSRRYDYPSRSSRDDHRLGDSGRHRLPQSHSHSHDRRASSPRSHSRRHHAEDRGYPYYGGELPASTELYIPQRRPDWILDNGRRSAALYPSRDIERSQQDDSRRGRSERDRDYRRSHDSGPKAPAAEGRRGERSRIDGKDKSSSRREEQGVGRVKAENIDDGKSENTSAGESAEQTVM
ncbi:MAG: hypothetical protein BJ554DRAFT_6589, partial [Olpidium bornovanus]